MRLGAPLSNRYLHALADAQIAAVENLAGPETTESARLGADYIAIAQIQRDQSTENGH